MAENGQRPKAEWLDPPVEEEGLRRYVETIRERWVLVLLAVLITTGMAVLYVFTAQKTYEARADLLVTPVSGDDPTLRSLPLIFESVDPTRDVETASQFVTNLNVANRVKPQFADFESPRDLLFQVSADPVAQSNIVAVTADAHTPEEAQNLANAFAKATVDERTAQVHAAIDSTLASLQSQLNQVGPGANRDALAAQLAQLQSLRSAPDPTIRLQTEADLPTTPSSPRPVLSIAGGLLAGLVLGIVGAFAAQILDPRLRRETQLRRLYRLPILTRVPQEGKSRLREPLGPRRLSAAAAEAYRTLRSTLEARTPTTGGGRVVLVTGSSPSEGKSTTAVNLASSLALAGRRVILIEADLRRPSLADALDVDAAHGGVVNVLIENATLEDALTTAPTYGPNMQLLLADYEGGWIAELFSIPAAGEMIDRARQLADYVVIDSPPLNEVVDALPLARRSDDVVVVVRLGRTRLDKLAQLGELLAENGIRPVGFAVVGVPRPSRSDYNYYRTPATNGQPLDRGLFGRTHSRT